MQSDSCRVQVSFLLSTINKNVDWIKYIYYNQQRFINYTHDTVKGIAEQLDATRKMAWENCIALDMLLAEKGGVCIMLGISFCMFIPNNTAPDGSISKALPGLATLADELAENSGVDTSWTGWLDSVFGKWKGVIVPLMTSFLVMASILAVIGCCITPCCRGLAICIVETALTKQVASGSPCEDWPWWDSRLAPYSRWRLLSTLWWSGVMTYLTCRKNNILDDISQISGHFISDCLCLLTCLEVSPSQKLP